MDARFQVEEAQASFRGVGFHVKKRSRDGGRRGPTHEAPQRDEPDGEDLGRKVRSFKLDAIVIGEGDTDTARQADCNRKTIQLLAALENKAGPGIYRDPWHGQWMVICRSVSAVDDEDHQFVTLFSITLEESGSTRYPLAAKDTATKVDGSADALAKAAGKSFDAKFVTDKVSQFVKASSKQRVSLLLDNLGRLGLTQLSATDAMGVEDVASELSGVSSRQSSLMSSGNLGEALVSLFRTLGASTYSRRASLGSASDARTAFAGLSSWGDTTATTAATASRQTEADNAVALSSLVRRLAVTEEARALAASTWESQDEAVVQRDATLERIAAVMTDAGTTGDDDVFTAARALAVAVTVDVDARAPAARVRRASFDTVLPACVIAHKLLGDGRKADDIAARNGVSNPAFMPAGKALEYVTDA